MMKRIALKFAASSLVLGVLTMGSMATGVAPATASAAQGEGRSDGRAGQLFERAGRAIAENQIAEAVGLLEEAVALSPRDAGYRLLLADAYMKSGRFRSAEQSYREVLAIDGARSRAVMGLALMQLANGRQQDALAELERLEGEAAPADIGLAYALAGAPQRAIDLLEPAARAMGATPRVRQNLALAYAFGGDWQRARTIAAQDVAPAELGERMTQWAALASRSGQPDQIATLLGVDPVADSGRPERLALNVGPPAVIAAPQPVGYAAAAPVAAQPDLVDVPMPTDAPVPAPVAFAEMAPPAAPAAMAGAAPAEAVSPPPLAFAEAAPAINPMPVPAPAPTVASPDHAAAADYAELETPEWGLDEGGAVALPEEAPVAERPPVRVQYAAAAETLIRPDPVVMPVASRASRVLGPVASRVIASAPLPGVRAHGGKFVVQIGAFSSAANAERAWQTYEGRFGLRAEQPVTMTIDHQGRLLHRVAIAGFVQRGEANQVCRIIRNRGGECFVRDNAGDSSIDWAARYTRRG